MEPAAIRYHGYLDIALIAGLIVLPVLARLPHGPRAVSWTAALALVAIVVMTDERIGLAHALPPEAHNALEVGLAGALTFGAALCFAGSFAASAVVLLLEAIAVGAAAASGLWASSSRGGFGVHREA